MNCAFEMHKKCFPFFHIRVRPFNRGSDSRFFTLIPLCTFLIKISSLVIICKTYTFYEVWALKNWCFWTVVLEKTLESPLHCQEIKPINPKGNQSWIFLGRADVEAEAPILWPSDVKSQIIGKDPDAGKDWRREEKGRTADEMVGWHHQLNGHEFE